MAAVSARPLQPDAPAAAAVAYAAAILRTQFEAEVAKRVSMGIYKTAKTQPVVLDGEALEKLAQEAHLAPTRCDPCIKYLV